jgi:hypothetical protein
MNHGSGENKTMQWESKSIQMISQECGMGERNAKESA